MRYAVTIPTYQRPDTLSQLLDDLARQSLQPDVLAVIDGDPDSGAVLRLLESFDAPSSWRLVYVPSTHANVSFQRYLCWRAAEGCDLFVYLDDDLRLPDAEFLVRLLAPFGWPNRHIAGVSARLIMGSSASPPRVPTRDSRLVRAFGSARRTPPGDVTPSGHRVWPLDDGADYTPIRWFYGAIMAFRHAALHRDCFPDAMFALNHVGAGIGIDDTGLTRCALASGELLLANCTEAEHPDLGHSKAMPEEAYALGYARSYSRRYLNDRYRYPSTPQLSDRADLIKSLVYTSAASWLQAVRAPRPETAAYARGFTVGSWQALTRPPNAQHLTPDIDWQADANRAIAQQRVLKTGDNKQTAE